MGGISMKPALPDEQPLPLPLQLLLLQLQTEAEGRDPRCMRHVAILPTLPTPTRAVGGESLGGMEQRWGPALTRREERIRAVDDEFCSWVAQRDPEVQLVVEAARLMMG